MLFSPGADAELDFGVSASKVNLKRNERRSRGLSGSVQLFEFLLMNQQLSGSSGRMVELMRFVILRDVAVDKPQFSVFHSGVGIRNITMSVPEAFDFASPEDNSALNLSGDVIIMPCAAVFGNVYESGIFRSSLFFLLFFSHDSSNLRRARSRSRHGVNDRIRRDGSRETVYDNWAR